jgi:hypothetical protein
MIIPAVDRPIAYTMSSTSPAERVEPITLDWLQLHLKFPSTNEDTILASYIAAARAHFEEQTGRQCVDAEWEYALDCAPDQQRSIELPRPPLASVVEVTYDDADGVATTFDAANYTVHPSFVSPDAGSPSDPITIDPYCPCGRIELVSGAAWPTTSGGARSLRIRRVCGYGATAEAMPALIAATLGLLVQHFRNRDLAALPIGPDSLIRAFKWTALQTQRPRRALVTYPLSDGFSLLN